MWDLIIRGARVFDGSGAPGVMEDLALRDGRVVARGQDLPATAAAAEHDASGSWLIPGLLDIHTHEDLEAELDADLPEIVRHGTTTAIVGNCSIGLAFGNQRQGNQDPIVDCFARVENIPKTVLSAAAEKATWNDSGDYYTHLDELPLAANIAPFLPHSMLRIQVMGLDASITRDPTDAEHREMEQLLEKAMGEGYLGMSTDGLPLHFLANEPNIKKRIPTQYAEFDEYKRLTDIVRRHGRVWQMTPATDDPALTLKLFMLSSGRLYGEPLKMTALAAIESPNNRMQKGQSLFLTRLLNSRAMNGHLRMQSLAAPFKVWSEGVVSPLAEANPLMRQLIETELDDRARRAEILSDPEFVDAFREMWEHGKSGFNTAHLLRRMRLENQFLTRDLNDMTIYRSPVDGWDGLTMAEVYRRFRGWRAAPHASTAPEVEREAFEALGDGIRDEGEFFLALLRTYDRDIYWHYVAANRDPAVIKQLLLHPLLLPGFNDSGAHVTNMAFYDGNLRALKIGLDDSEALFSHMVGRLTREPAEFFGLEAGRIDSGSPADITLLDPDALRAYDGEASIELIQRELFGCEQLVNRSDGVVRSVFVGGELVWDGQGMTPPQDNPRRGRALRAGAASNSQQMETR